MQPNSQVLLARVTPNPHVPSYLTSMQSDRNHKGSQPTYGRLQISLRSGVPNRSRCTLKVELLEFSAQILKNKCFKEIPLVFFILKPFLGFLINSVASYTNRAVHMCHIAASYDSLEQQVYSTTSCAKQVLLNNYSMHSDDPIQKFFF